MFIMGVEGTQSIHAQAKYCHFNTYENIHLRPISISINEFHIDFPAKIETSGLVLPRLC